MGRSANKAKTKPRLSESALVRQAKKREARESAARRRQQLAEDWRGRVAGERKRLRSILPERLSQLIGDDRKYEEETGVPHATLQGWTQQGKSYSALPGLDALCAIADRHDVTLDWVAGRSERDPTQDLAHQLKEHIARVFGANTGFRYQFVAEVLPAPTELIETLVAHYLPQVQARADQWITLDAGRRQHPGRPLPMTSTAWPVNEAEARALLRVAELPPPLAEEELDRRAAERDERARHVMRSVTGRLRARDAR